jgi:SAM-dependent methyltransferase
MSTCETNDEQARVWNGTAGHAWVETQTLLDQIFEPFEIMLTDAAAVELPRSVLDVGCGTGSTSLAIAQRLGPGCQVTGVDISGPMIALAATRAGRAGTLARFVRADAQDYSFEPASVDMIVSRFGIMFFSDPVRAFANLHRAARPGALLQVIPWRSGAENPFMTTAERTAAPLLSNLPPRRPDAPGQFAFADDRRVMDILRQSGWSDIDIRPLDVECTFPESRLVTYLTRLGPVGTALSEADDATRARVIDVVRSAFDSFVHGDTVRFVAACWMVTGRA